MTPPIDELYNDPKIVDWIADMELQAGIDKMGEEPMTPPIPQGPKEVDAEAVLTPETLKADIREFMDMLKWHGGAEEVTQRRLVLDARRKVIKHADAWADQLRQQTERVEALKQRLAELGDKVDPKARPMTVIENRCMDLEGEVKYLQAALYHAIVEGGSPEGYEVEMDHEHGMAALAAGEVKP